MLKDSTLNDYIKVPVTVGVPFFIADWIEVKWKEKGHKNRNAFMMKLLMTGIKKELETVSTEKK